MEITQNSFDKIDVKCALLINKRIINDVDMNEYVREISTYVNHVNELFIYNFTNQDLTEFYKRLSKYNNISYTTIEDYGQAMNYQIAFSELAKRKASFGMVTELGYYYEEGSFLALRRFATTKDTSKIAIITPLPLRGCEEFSRDGEEYRNCMGCNIVGALVNLNVFKELGGFKTDYYQTTFDYEYCLRARSKGYNVVLLQNEVFRNTNYRIIEKKFFFNTLSMFDYDLMDLYYQTRNRFYLWDEYETIDPKYVKLDKKLYKQEIREIKNKDPNYRDKFLMIEEAKFDYRLKKIGKYKGE